MTPDPFGWFLPAGVSYHEIDGDILCRCGLWREAGTDCARCANPREYDREEMEDRKRDAEERAERCVGGD